VGHVPMDITQKAQLIKLLILDVDGVMTDGKVVYSDSGEELKFFDSRDGHGIKMLMRTGIDVAIITGRISKAVEHRAENLGIALVYQKALNKIEAYDEIASLKKLSDQYICAVGDDLPDIPVLRRAGFAVAVPDAVDEVKAVADYTTHRSGGNGAVREVCDLIMKAQRTWQTVTSRYYSC
jgi:3-deoxy-D-manno-octulosonate 8-phosphate phosphatase (KDO 8-P phosphatase)